MEFKYIDLPRLTKWTVEKIIDAIQKGLNEVEVTLDLGLSKEKVVIENNTVVFRGKYRVKLDLLKEISENRVYEVVGDNEIVEISIRTEHMYKLRPVSETDAPTLEIDGIHMHRITGITPWEDSRRKVLAAKIGKGDIVLDTCMGLGYTAIHALLRGASKVYTVEVDENVIAIAQRNPWSKMLSDKRIEIIHGDVTEVVRYFPTEYFDKIIHDPPRFSRRTGNLYGLKFYLELHRVLKPGGILFHYTGEPGKRGARKIVKGIGERLSRAGFHTMYDREVQGYVAIKYAIPF
ncbi:RsmD family RNA methyltransferase [Desulfurococcaceae archaeon MEX13E-LK6-19]|nr:RsmD family RNA methyltransferase [Desulfurococcaceae archaeon MEX13E-LK6-19]